MEAETLKIWIQIIVAFVAIYGAFLSTLIYIRNKKKIFFEFGWGLASNNLDKVLLFYKIANTGQIPISVNNIGIKIKGKKEGINQILQQQVTLPIILKNEEHVTIPVELSAVKEAFVQKKYPNNIKIKGVFFDVSNKKYYSKHWMKIDLSK
jgi:hypothetical protein